MTNILLEKKNGIAYVTINREEALNCFNYDSLRELQEVTDKLVTGYRSKRGHFYWGRGQSIQCGRRFERTKNINGD